MLKTTFLTYHHKGKGVNSGNRREQKLSLLSIGLKLAEQQLRPHVKPGELQDNLLTKNIYNMSPTITSLEEAMEWFLENHSGSIICQSGNKEKECFSFSEAKDFFAKKNTDGQ